MAAYERKITAQIKGEIANKKGSVRKNQEGKQFSPLL